MHSDSEKNLRLEIGHVLFIDLVGYSKLLIEEQRERLHQLTEIVLATPQVQEAPNEQLIRLPTGDGMALVFRNSLEEPVGCAVEIAQALRGHAEIAVRMGIHSGPVSDVTDVSGRGNIAGAGINMAQRVMDCGDAGHILLSKRVADDLGHYVHWRPQLHDLSEVEVKHGVRLGLVNLYRDGIGNPQLPEKIRALKERRSRRRWAGIFGALLPLVVVGVAFLSILRKPATSISAVPEKSIAVMPFDNLSRDPDNAYFASGIQAEILTKLAAIGDLKVISRASTEKYRSHPEDLKKVASELGVATILEGNVQKAGDRAHINVQLIEARTDSHLWAQVYDRDLKNIFAVEGEVAEAVAAALKLKLLPSTTAALESPSTRDPAAYDLYLRAQYAHEEWFRGKGNSEEALKYLRAAIALDPKYATAYATLAIFEAQKAGAWGGVDLALENDARANAEKALVLQPELPAANAAKGLVYLYLDRNYSKAIEYLQRGAYRFSIPMAIAQSRLGFWNEAVQTMRRVVELNPRDAHSFGELAHCHGNARQYEEAARALDRGITLDPNDWNCVMEKADLLLALGETDAAREILQKMSEQVRTLRFFDLRWRTEFLARNYAAALEAAEAMDPPPAKSIYDGLKEIAIGRTAMALGRREEAMRTLDEARAKAEALVATHPDVAELHQRLASIYAARGERQRALEEAGKAVALLPINREPDLGHDSLEVLAEVHACFADADQAIPLIRRLLDSDGAGFLMTAPLLKLDPIWDPIRNDSRFQMLAESLPPKDPK